MKRLALSLAFLLVPAAVHALQEETDRALKSLADKLSKDGVSGRLARALETESGRQATLEKIEFLLQARISRLERDGQGFYEDHFFSTDANGDLRVRAERKAEIEDLARRLSIVPVATADFNRRCDDLVKRLKGEGELEKCARAAWSSPEFRAAFFHRHPGELRENSDEEILDAAGFRGFERGGDGKRRVAGPFGPEMKERVEEITDRIEEAGDYEKSYLKFVAGVNDAGTRALLGSEFALRFLIGRVLRQAAEGSPTVIGSSAEGNEDRKVEPSITFTADPAQLAADVKEGEKTLAGLKALLDRLAGEAEDAKIAEFLRNGRVRILLAERVHGARQERRRKSEELMKGVLEDGFAADGDGLVVKKRRYVDDAGKDSVQALKAELSVVIEEFNGSMRQDFDRIAERCVEPAVIAIFENRPATFLLMEHRERVIEGLIETARQQGAATFEKMYLLKQGDRLVVRPDRAGRIEALLQRAADVEKERKK